MVPHDKAASSPQSFDPYYLWLGIPPTERPIDFYRLLGVPRFESNIDVIEIAADRQMAHVKTFVNGEFGTISQSLLNELSRAKTTLCREDKKAAYDVALRQSLQASPLGVATAPAASQVLIHGESRVHTMKAVNRRRRSRFIPAVILTLALLCIATWLPWHQLQKQKRSQVGVLPPTTQPPQQVVQPQSADQLEAQREPARVREEIQPSAQVRPDGRGQRPKAKARDPRRRADPKPLDPAPTDPTPSQSRPSPRPNQFKPRTQPTNATNDPVSPAKLTFGESTVIAEFEQPPTAMKLLVPKVQGAPLLALGRREGDRWAIKHPGSESSIAHVTTEQSELRFSWSVDPTEELRGCMRMCMFEVDGQRLAGKHLLGEESPSVKMADLKKVSINVGSLPPSIWQRRSAASRNQDAELLFEILELVHFADSGGSPLTMGDCVFEKRNRRRKNEPIERIIGKASGGEASGQLSILSRDRTFRILFALTYVSGTGEFSILPEAAFRLPGSTDWTPIIMGSFFDSNSIDRVLVEQQQKRVDAQLRRSKNQAAMKEAAAEISRNTPTARDNLAQRATKVARANQANQARAVAARRLQTNEEQIQRANRNIEILEDIRASVLRNRMGEFRYRVVVRYIHEKQLVDACLAVTSGGVD